MKLTSACFLMLLTISVFADTQRQIEFNDGSIISGEIVSFSNGVYTIKSNNLGTLKIQDSKIRAIHSESTYLTSDKKFNPQLPSLRTGLQAVQGLIMNSPNLMDTVLSLQNDPDFQSALQDSDVMNAVNSGDFNALLVNQNFMKLIEKPMIKEIAQEIEVK